MYLPRLAVRSVLHYRDEYCTDVPLNVFTIGIVVNALFLVVYVTPEFTMEPDFSVIAVNYRSCLPLNMMESCCLRVFVSVKYDGLINVCILVYTVFVLVYYGNLR